MKSLFFKVLLFVFIPLMTVSCGDFFSMPTSSGRPYEVLVVINDSMWQRPSGRALFDVLDTDVPGLPQSERSFPISQTDPRRFSRTLNIFRNIIMVDIDPAQYTQTKIRYAKDVYAHPQVVMTIQSPDEASFGEYVAKHSQEIVDFFNRVEMNRLADDLEEKHSTVVAQLASEIFGCGFWAPSEIKSYKKGKDFFWTSSDGAASLVNICMYSYPYEGPHTFNKEYVIAKRDSVMKENIPGAKPHMYMATDTLCTGVKPIVIKGQYAMEMRGLWVMKNDGMGGPFVSHSRVDTDNNRVIVVEGFVYAPEKKKRGLIRRLEGSLYTLCLPGETVRELKANMPELEVTVKKEQN